MVALPEVYHTLDDSGNPKRTQLVFPQVYITFIYYGTTIVQYLQGLVLPQLKPTFWLEMAIK
jgi:hypothetical protein